MTATTFRDKVRHTVVVEIDLKRWNGVTVTPRDKVELQVKSIKTGTSLKST